MKLRNASFNVELKLTLNWFRGELNWCNHPRLVYREKICTTFRLEIVFITLAKAEMIKHFYFSLIFLLVRKIEKFTLRRMKEVTEP